MSSAPLPTQSPWWVKAEAAPASAAPRFRGVAYYRHSARDRQENSVAIQQELVQKWAKENGVDIIHEFSDRGKSGLTAEGRDGFNEMMETWVKKRKDFDFVLCLDVSRWGRFQDIDLSATYSADCKKHGKQVIYTTLGMPRPDDPLYPVYVQFERFRAAQYSKELSAKVFHGCVKIAQQGYWAGGKAPYGFDRLLLDEARNRLHVLTRGQKKSIQNQRVTLTLGPEDQVVTVRRIFDDYIDAGHTMEQIADRLNAEGSRSAMGGAWNTVKIRRILTNIMYAGTLVYNKTTSKLKTPTRRNPIDQWVQTAGAIDPVVPQFEILRLYGPRLLASVPTGSSSRASSSPTSSRRSRPCCDRRSNGSRATTTSSSSTVSSRSSSSRPCPCRMGTASTGTSTPMPGVSWTSRLACRFRPARGRRSSAMSRCRDCSCGSAASVSSERRRPGWSCTDTPDCSSSVNWRGHKWNTQPSV